MSTTSLTKSQDAISLKINIPFLAANTMIMEHLQGHEGISQPFEFTLRLASQNHSLSYKRFLGKSVTVSFHSKSTNTQKESNQSSLNTKSLTKSMFSQAQKIKSKGSESEGKEAQGENQPRDANTRYINGVVGQFTQLVTATPGDDNATHYEIKLYPSLWLLKFKQDCRIFQNLSSMEIIKLILKENNVLDFKDLTRSQGDKKREYCVQYNESCFDFVHRLLEEEGIFYYFDHTSLKHTLIFGDDSSVHSPYATDGQAEMRHAQTTQDFLGYITSCFLKHQVVPRGMTLKDYNFTLASTDLLSKSTGDGEVGEIYQYPAQFDHEDKPDKEHIEGLALRQLQRDEVSHKMIEGTSTIPYFTPGFWFQLKGHPRTDANGKYILQTVYHECDMSAEPHHQSALYHNTYHAFPARIHFRPSKKTSKPRIYSTQTALVTGPQSEEIWVDKYGRIKVQFHWDRLSKGDQESSCWVRVAEGWAGNNWGMVFTPRVGMEVVVTFIEGDPDRPLVIGSVYNSNNLPPYLPEQPTKSTIKSNSSKGGEGSNEIRFEDSKDSEQLYVHAQKDCDIRVKENSTSWIEKGSFWQWIDQGNRETILDGTIEGLAKTTPQKQNLPAGAGDDNLTLLKGKKTTKLLGQESSYNIIITKGDHFVQLDQGKKYIIGDQVSEFIQINQGNFDKLIKSGDRSTVTYDGNVHDYIINGHKTMGITTGNWSQEVINGHMLMGVDQGSLMEVVENGKIGRSITQGTMNDLIDQGNYNFDIKQGNSNYKLHLGDETTELHQGNQTLKLFNGNQSIELVNGNRTIKVDNGNENHTINGSYNQHIFRNHTLHVDGNLTIVVGGKIKIESIAGMNFSTPGSIAFSAGENINFSAGMSISQKAGMNITQSAGMATNIRANLEMSFNAMTISQNASVSYNVEAGVESTLTAGAMMTLAAPMLTIG